jgi:hypothetical protein
VAKLKLVVDNVMALPRAANGATPPSGPQFIHVRLNRDLPFEELKDWVEAGLPAFGTVVPAESPGTFYLSNFTMPLETITRQFTLFGEDVMSWEFA